MKITKLVILFNYKKLLLGIVVSLLLFFLSSQFNSDLVSWTFITFGFLILLNIIASLLASYILYDQSNLYNIEDLDQYVNFKQINNAVLVHASFDPLSLEIEDKFPNLNLTVCDIYGNRHEHESGIKVSKKVFPPNPKEIKIHPNQLPFEDNSQDVILAITAVHEILNHQDRVLFFKEAKRILKDNGIIVLSEQFRDTTNFMFFNIGAFHFLSKKQWTKAIGEASLKISKWIKITPFATMLVIKK